MCEKSRKGFVLLSALGILAVVFMMGILIATQTTTSAHSADRFVESIRLQLLVEDALAKVVHSSDPVEEFGMEQSIATPDGAAMVEVVEPGPTHALFGRSEGLSYRDGDLLVNILAQLHHADRTGMQTDVRFLINPTDRPAPVRLSNF